MNPVRSPIARELFKQWQRVRGGRIESSGRPFSMAWEDLLDEAGLHAAVERADAERDVRELESDGKWVELKPVRYKPHQIERIRIPLSSEPRWFQAFGFVPPTDEEMRRIQSFDWEPRLSFLREIRVQLPAAELFRLDEFLKSGSAAREMVPVKERSLQIFGDEKRLDELAGSALFGQGRLNLEQDLRCENIGVPLGWSRGPSGVAGRPLLVVENAATWHSFSRWNLRVAQFAAVVYGDGNRFVEGLRYLRPVMKEACAAERILYFGDIDLHGLWIPQWASTRCMRYGLPPVEPCLPCYRRLLELGQGRAREGVSGRDAAAAAGEGDVAVWLGPMADAARDLLKQGRWLPQEHLGWEQIANLPGLEI